MFGADVGNGRFEVLFFGHRADDIYGAREAGQRL